ncbi:hypothetical protein OS493_004858 [Desmophyllum pertusum]|uniref:Uncharacterized protein n=1 Tax=Desmophyllum pertusum TaxID=174260 RepID=A0A9X0CT00_9CNID|nr:hypothetical protein OS493_004858 [Desmophyllum pertusum]
MDYSMCAMDYPVRAMDYLQAHAMDYPTCVRGRKLQVSIQKQDENGRYHVLLFADPGHAQICVNDELVINGFATCFSDETQTSDISPTKAAKLKAMSDKFQKDGAEMLKNLKEYVNHGKFTGSEESNSTDDELTFLDNRFSGHNSYQEEHGLRCEPSARIPKGATQSFSSQRFSPEKPFVEGGSGGESGKDGLPATGSGMGAGFPSIPSKSPDSANLKPILKKRSPHGTRQGSGSSRENACNWTEDDSGVSCSEIPELSSNDTNGDSSLKEKKGKEPSASSNSISVDALFGHHRETSHSGLENADFVRKAKAIEPLAQGNTDEMSPQRILSLIESLRDASGKSFGSTSDSSATEAVRTCESLQVVNNLLTLCLAIDTLHYNLQQAKEWRNLPADTLYSTLQFVTNFYYFSCQVASSFRNGIVLSNFKLTLTVHRWNKVFIFGWCCYWYRGCSCS